MHTTPARIAQRGALTALAALALAAGTSAARPAPASTTYRIIPLSTTTSFADINASGQVAFTELLNGEVPRGIFYDGKTRQDIGTLGGPSTATTALNDAGQITGVSTTAAGISHVFRWSRSTGMIDLVAPGMGFSISTDINNQGWVTGTAEFTPERFTAFRWRPTTGMVNLGSLGTNSTGLALNNAGTVVGVSETTLGGFGQHAVRWPGTQPIAITPFATPSSAARDINNAGQIVGTAALDASLAERAFLWSSQTGPVDLGVSASNFPSVERINDRGLVIGNLYSPDSSQGFVWSRATGPIILSPPDVFSATADLNNRGQVVGTYNERAFVWTRAEGVVDLNTRLANAPPGLVLSQAFAISDNGSIVANTGSGLVLLVPNAGSSNAAPVAAPIKLTGTPRVNALLSFYAAFKDTDLRDTYKASWDWGDGSSSAGMVSAKNGAGSVSGQHAWRKAGTYTVKLTITDSGGQRTTVKRTVVVCASGATIVGEGAFLSPAGAYTANPAGPARALPAAFSFASEARGTGLASVRFNVANLFFRSTRVESLVNENGRIEYRGTGTVNGKGNYRFLLSAGVGSKAGSAERLRIRITHTAPGSKAEVVDYDNQLGGAVTGGGALVVETTE